jgi:hypothetical protein
VVTGIVAGVASEITSLFWERKRLVAETCETAASAWKCPLNGQIGAFGRVPAPGGQKFSHQIRRFAAVEFFLLNHAPFV